MSRAVMISARNLAFLIAAITVVREAGTVLPAWAIVGVLLAAAAAVYLQVRARDHRGEEVSPGLLLCLFFLVFGVMAYARSMADQGGFQVHYNYVIDMDRSVFGAVPSVWLQEHLHTPGKVNALDAGASLVYFSYFVVPIVTGTLLWHASPRVFRLYLATTILMIAFGSLTFTLLPTAPPWLAALDGHLPPIARIAPEVAELIRPGFYERGYQAVGVNDVAAFPSYHTAQTLVVALVGWRFGRGLGVVGTMYAGAMAFSLVYLGEHYVADVIAGMAVALMAWLAATKITPLRGSYPVSVRPSVSIEVYGKAA